MHWVYWFRDFVTRCLQTLGVLFGMVPRVGRLPGWAYHAIHYAFVILITLLLGWLSPQQFQPTNLPRMIWFVQEYYLAVLFLLVYVFVRLALAAVRLFLTRDVSEFEDIDRAWYAGLDALAREGYDLQWLPVFLVVGLDPEQEADFFRSANFAWKVSGPPADQRLAALSFHVCDEAAFICLNDVGAMSAQMRHAAPGVKVAGGTEPPPGRQMTMRPGQIQAALQSAGAPVPERAHEPGAAAAPAPAFAPADGRTIRPGELAQARRAAAAPRAGAAPAAASGALRKLGKEELERHRARLEHFCRRLAEERQPYCPLNGLLQMLPLRWTDSPRYEELYAAAAADQTTLRICSRMHFPVVCAHGGLHAVVGVEEFLQRGTVLNENFRETRAGSRYAPGLPLEEQHVRGLVDRSLHWFRDWVYAAFAQNLGSSQNRRLYQFLCHLTRRREQLCRELRLIFEGVPGTVRLSGCYFVAAGAEPERQGFSRGVLLRLIDEQNDVAWTAESRAGDRRCHRLSIAAALLAVALLGADVWLGAEIWRLTPQVTQKN